MPSCRNLVGSVCQCVFVFIFISVFVSVSVFVIVSVFVFVDILLCSSHQCVTQSSLLAKRASEAQRGPEAKLKMSSKNTNVSSFLT